MTEVLNTSDAVRLSFLRAVLEDAGISSVVFDAGAPWPGAIPSRLMVADEDAWMAKRLVADAEAEASRDGGSAAGVLERAPRGFVDAVAAVDVDSGS